MLEERERAAVQGRGRDDGVARLREVQDRERLGGLTGRRRDGRDASFERREAPLEDVGRGVHDARVDVPELAQAEEARGVLGPVEHVRRRRVDRHGPRVRGGVGGLLRGVDGDRAGAIAGFRWGLGRVGRGHGRFLLSAFGYKKNRPSRVRGPVGESDELFRLCSRFAWFRSVLRDGPREASVRLPRRSAGHRAHAHAIRRDRSRVEDGGRERGSACSAELRACDSKSQAKRRRRKRTEEPFGAQ